MSVRINMLIKISGLIALSYIFFSPSAFSWKWTKEPDIRGNIEMVSKGDTLYVLYHLTPEYFEPDSVKIRFVSRTFEILIDVNDYSLGQNEIVVYKRGEEILLERYWRKVSFKRGRLYFDGKVKIPLKGNNDFKGYCSIIGYYTDEEEKTTYVYVRRDNAPYFGMGMEMYLPSYGYFESSFNQPFDKKELFLGFGGELAYIDKKFRIALSSSWSGLGTDFAFSDPLRLEYRYHTGRSNNFLPSLFTAAKLSKIKFIIDEVEYREFDWGVEFGIATEGPFERIGYSYSTTLGGFHTVELFLAFFSDHNAKIGTRFTFQKAEDVWMFRIATHIQGADVDSHVKGNTLSRENRRPLPHKILSTLGGLPALAAYIPYLFGKKVLGLGEK